MNVLEVIKGWIKKEAEVLDLGCGDGKILNILSRELQVKPLGIEIDEDNLNKCIASGLSVIQQDIDDGLDNFSDNMSDGEFGEIVFHLGNISEDILPDGKKQYENGLPVDESDTFQSSVWGNTPSTQSIIYAFNNIESQRQKQDLGYDGLDDDDELNNYSNGNPEDPAGDNYEYPAGSSGFPFE